MEQNGSPRVLASESGQQESVMSCPSGGSGNWQWVTLLGREGNWNSIPLFCLFLLGGHSRVDWGICKLDVRLRWVGGVMILL